jgi:hypothetical protein
MGPKPKRTKPVDPDAKTAVLPALKPKPPVDPEAKTERIIITPPPRPAPKLK